MISIYDKEILSLFMEDMEKGNIENLGDSSNVFQKITQYYPSYGSKIDWDSISGAVQESEWNSDLHSFRFSKFFHDIVSEQKIRGSIIYAGDSATSFAYCGDVEILIGYLDGIFQIPQHHYFVDFDYGWCMTMTMEGDMAFGRRSMGGS